MRCAIGWFVAALLALPPTGLGLRLAHAGAVHPGQAGPGLGPTGARSATSVAHTQSDNLGPVSDAAKHQTVAAMPCHGHPAAVATAAPDQPMTPPPSGAHESAGAVFMPGDTPDLAASHTEASGIEASRSTQPAKSDSKSACPHCGPDCAGGALCALACTGAALANTMSLPYSPAAVTAPAPELSAALESWLTRPRPPPPRA